MPRKSSWLFYGRICQPDFILRTKTNGSKWPKHSTGRDSTVDTPDCSCTHRLPVNIGLQYLPAYAACGFILPVADQCMGFD